MMEDFDAYVGLDVHKDTIAVAVAARGRAPAEFVCELPNRGGVVAKLLGRVSGFGARLSFAYEAGPCGYVLWRELTGRGADCVVAAPSLIPRASGARVKTDRRDALALARLHRAGSLVAVRVPNGVDEAVRDLSRAREDMKAAQRAARQRLCGFLLRHGKVYRAGKTRWTKTHMDWIEGLDFEAPASREALVEYLDAVRDADRRVASAARRVEAAVRDWPRRPLVEALVALRGIDFTAAATLAAELGDLSRFASPRQLMAFVGLVPGEHSSGARRRTGAITRTGNAHARRMLVEAAWCHRFPARQTPISAARPPAPRNPRGASHGTRRSASAPASPTSRASASRRRRSAPPSHANCSDSSGPSPARSTARQPRGTPPEDGRVQFTARHIGIGAWQASVETPSSTLWGTRAQARQTPLLE